MLSDPVCIVSTARTPIGALSGQFASLPAYELGRFAIEGVMRQSGLALDAVQEAIIGCVLSAGQGQAPARQACLNAKLDKSISCTTINKMCGSGMMALMFATDMLQLGRRDVMLAGGIESMSNAPYLVPRARQGLNMGHAQLMDHMFLDGLEDAYERSTLMGVFAERCAEKYNISREEQDNFTLSSLERAQQAARDNIFAKEITPVDVTSRKGTLSFTEDELPTKARPDKIPTLRPAFKKDGTVTAANSSGISDGAAMHLLMRESTAKEKGLKPLAKIIGHATHSHEPEWFTTAPTFAIKSLLQQIGWNSNDVDLYEINEAFAVVTIAAMKELGLDHDKVNVHGGACALGHPIGASGARIVTTLINALRHHNLKRGVASLCIGGGEATAMAIELLD